MRRPVRRSGSSAPGVGFSLGLPHSIHDVEEAVAGLHTDMTTFGQELHDQLFLPGAFDQPRPGAPPDQLDLYRQVWRPLMNEWLQFRDVHANSFWQNLPFSGAWDRVQEFRQRLIAVRNQARAMHVRLVAPDPAPPRLDPEIPDLGTPLRILAYGGVGVAAVLVLRSLAR